MGIGEQRWIRDDQRPASATFPADPIGRRVRLCLAAQLRQSAVDRAARYARDARDRRDPGRAQRPAPQRPQTDVARAHPAPGRVLNSAI